MENSKVVGPIEIFTSLDLELAQPSNKIISIGAVIGNIRTGEILEEFHEFVNPNEQLSPFIMELTKIKQSDVDAGLTLEDAYSKLKALQKKHKSFVNPITWGGGDSQFMQQQLKDRNPAFEGWCFGRRWIDVKTLYVSYRLANGEQVQGGLSKAMTKFGLAFKGQKHNAKDDSLNTFIFYHTLLQLLKKNK